MTTHDLAHGQDRDEDALDALFASSPDRPVHTSAAAVLAFVLGLLASVAAPFSLMLALAGGLAVIGLVSSVVGMARASRPDVAGGVLAPLGLCLSVVALAELGLRYLGLDTAFGDALLPTLGGWLHSLNGLLPAP